MTSAAGSMPTDGRWDRYRDHEGREYQRVSTLIKKVETDRYHLDLWIKRQVLIGASRRDDIVTGVKAMKPHPVTGWSDAQKSDLNKLVKTAEEAAKDTDGAVLGTATHTLTERLDRGEPLDDVVAGLPAQIERDVRAYEALIRLNGWRSIEIERTVVNDEIDVAGTFDRVYFIPGLTELLGPGQCQHGHEAHHDYGQFLSVIGDVKSERSPEKNGLHIGPQLAIYARARRMWLPEGQYVDTPCVRQDVAVAVHVRDGHATPYFVDIRSGWTAALAARTQNEREKAAKAWLAPMPGIREPAPMEVAAAVAVSQDYGNPDRPGTLVMPPLPGAQPWHDAVNTACNNCASLVASATRVDGTPCDVICTACGKTALPANGIDIVTGEAAAPGTQVSYRRPDGMVEWRPVAESPIGTQVTVSGIGFTKVDTQENVVSHGALDDVDKQAIDTVWSATDLGGLARVFEIYTGTVGREWRGRVAEAGAARRAQIECVQRATHGAPGGLKCACGWTKGILP